MRKVLIVGAQKLYLSLEDSKEFAGRMITIINNRRFSFDLAICPSFINLAHVADILKGSQIALGAQNVHQEDIGAFTGQVSMKELIAVGVKYVIVGHSELRNQQRETNEMVSRKVKMSLTQKVIPITCVGESKEEKDAGRSEEVIERDLREIFTHISKEHFAVENVVIAYEPVWAIKAGRKDKATEAASPSSANKMHEFIRTTLSKIYDSNIAEKIRILYGGSVAPENTKNLLEEPAIDGLLIGTASIKIESLLKIIEAAEERIGA